jgi:hypothetical protein
MRRLRRAAVSNKSQAMHAMAGHRWQHGNTQANKIVAMKPTSPSRRRASLRGGELLLEKNDKRATATHQNIK